MSQTSSGTSMSDSRTLKIVGGVLLLLGVVAGVIFLVMHLSDKNKDKDSDKDSNRPDTGGPGTNLNVTHLGFSVQNTEFPWCVPTSYAYAYQLNGRTSAMSTPSPAVQSDTASNPIMQLIMVDGANVIVYRRQGATSEFVQIDVSVGPDGVFVDRNNPCRSLPAPPAPTFPIGDIMDGNVSWEEWANTPGSNPWVVGTMYAYSFFNERYETDLSQWTTVVRSTKCTNPRLGAATNPVFGRRWYRRTLINAVDIPTNFTLQWVLEGVTQSQQIGGPHPLLNDGPQPITVIISIANRHSTGEPAFILEFENNMLGLINTSSSELTLAESWGVLGFAPGTVPVGGVVYADLGGSTQTAERLIDEDATDPIFIDRENPWYDPIPPSKPEFTNDGFQDRGATWQAEAGPGRIPWCIETRYACMFVNENSSTTLSEWSDPAMSMQYTNPMLQTDNHPLFTRSWFRKIESTVLVNVTSISWSASFSDRSVMLVESVPTYMTLQRLVGLCNQPDNTGRTDHEFTVDDDGYVWFLYTAASGGVVIRDFERQAWIMLGFTQAVIMANTRTRANVRPTLVMEGSIVAIGQDGGENPFVDIDSVCPKVNRPQNAPLKIDWEFQ